MLSGHNTDVHFEGTVLHVQSEDRGSDNPVLESLVYCGGQILYHERTEYGKEARHGGGGAPPGHAEIARRLEQQHRDIVRRARHGEFTLDHARRFDDTVAPAALFETIERLLTDGSGMEPLELAWNVDMIAYGGLAGTLVVRRGGASGGPACGVRVLARLLGRGLDPVEVFSGETDPDGSVEIAIALPPAGATGLLFRAEDGAAGGRLRVAIAPRDGSIEPGVEDAAEELELDPADIR